MRGTRLRATTAAACVAVVSATGATAAAAVPARVQVDNTVEVLDTAGELLDAHDGDLILGSDGWVYLFGTSYGCGFLLDRPSSYCGVRIYRTRDLATFEPVGSYLGRFAFDMRDTGAGSVGEICSYPGTGCFRPHVVRRPSDGTYVMWLNSHGGTGKRRAGYLVFTADTPAGPWERVPGTPTLAVDPGDGGLEHGDMDLVVDEDGVGYIVYTVITESTNFHELVVERLNPSLTSGTRVYRRVPAAGSFVEAPGLFQGPDGAWYLAFSDPAVPYGVAPTSVLEAPGVLGPYGGKRVLATNSCAGQFAGVAQLGDVYVYESDRWQQPRTGPNTGIVPNQYRADNYYGRLTFAQGSGLVAHDCQPTWTFSLPR